MADGSEALTPNPPNVVPAPNVATSGFKLPEVHFPTLCYATGVAVFLFGIVLTVFGGIGSRVDAIAERVAGIPTKSEMGEEIERVAEIQRQVWDANAARVEASARAMDVSAEGIREQIGMLESNNRQVTTMLNERVNALDVRIANLGIDYSGALIEYFRTGRTAPVVGTDGSGGPDGAEDVYRDYAIRLAVRDANMSLADAIRFVDRAFLNQRGPEASRLSDLARQARQSNRGVAND